MTLQDIPDHESHDRFPFPRPLPHMWGGEARESLTRPSHELFAHQTPFLLLESGAQPKDLFSAAMPTDYLERILNAQVYDVAIETPLDLAPSLSARLGNRILLKREDLQPVFSFKLRGAYNKIAHLSAERLKRGVICASAGNHAQGVALGNHAQGVALAAAKLGCRAVIVMPTTTPQIKVQAVQARGAEVVLAGEGYDDAYTHALELEKSERLSFVHPFDDPEVIAGQGTIGMEILRQHAKPIHAVFCCIGGGGLISGVWRSDFWRRGLHQAGQAGNPDHRGRSRRRRCHDTLAESRQARPAGSRRPVRRWRGGQVCRRGNFPPLSDVRRRHGAGGYRRDLRGDQGRFRRYPCRPRAGRRTGSCRCQGLCQGAQTLCQGAQTEGQNADRDGIRRQHELRPSSFCRRACRDR